MLIKNRPLASRINAFFITIYIYTEKWFNYVTRRLMVECILMKPSKIFDYHNRIKYFMNKIFNRFN